MNRPTRLSERPLSYLNNEHLHQAALIDWIDSDVIKQHPELAWLYAVPNGGDRAKATAVKMKAEGVKRGVWDLCLPVRRNDCCGLYIEMKYGKNGLTKEQKEFGDFVRLQGYKTVVCYSWIEAKTELLEYLNGQ